MESILKLNKMIMEILLKNLNLWETLLKETCPGKQPQAA